MAGNLSLYTYFCTPLYINNTQNHITAGILIDDISDYLPIIIVIETKNIKEVKSQKNTQRKNMNNIEM